MQVLKKALNKKKQYTLRKSLKLKVRKKKTPPNNVTNIGNYSPYEIMALNKDCSIDDLKKKYKQLALIYHPDNGGDSRIFSGIVDSYNKIFVPP